MKLCQKSLNETFIVYARPKIEMSHSSVKSSGQWMRPFCHVRLSSCDVGLIVIFIEIRLFRYAYLSEVFEIRTIDQEDMSRVLKIDSFLFDNHQCNLLSLTNTTGIEMVHHTATSIMPRSSLMDLYVSKHSSKYK